jgi:protein SDA1
MLHHASRHDDYTNFPVQLLEDHLKKLREEEGSGVGDASDEEAAWEGWELDPDSSDVETEDEGWIDVDSDGGDLNISSEDEADAKANGKTGPSPLQVESTESVNRVSTLATTKVCPVS